MDSLAGICEHDTNYWNGYKWIKTGICACTKVLSTRLNKRKSIWRDVTTTHNATLLLFKTYDRVDSRSGGGRWDL